MIQSSENQLVNTFSLVHQDLYVSTNSVQYSVIMDVLNNLLLFVEPMALSRSESYLRLKYKLMLSNPKDLKKPIVQLQHSVKQLMHELRMKEKLLQQARARRTLETRGGANDSAASTASQQQQRQVETDLGREVQRLRSQLSVKANELSVHVSLFHEDSLLLRSNSSSGPQMSMHPGMKKKDELWKRWMLNFSRAEWRLTECDGQLGIADVAIDNLTYSKSVMRDDSTEHLLEMSNLSVKNLLKNQAYVDVLFPTQLRNAPLDQQRSIRVFCRERPPVGGISVKDHFEVNVVPLSIGVTQSFYKKIIEFCFPEDPATPDGSSANDTSAESRRRKRLDLDFDEEEEEDDATVAGDDPLMLPSDDVEQMRERAKLNKLFIYIKIPAVPICLSFKGDGRSSKGNSGGLSTSSASSSSKGSRSSKILDVENFVLQVPMLEYHNVTWTWLDFLLAVKSHTKDSLLSQAIKKKLTLSVLTRRGSRRRAGSSSASGGADGASGANGGGGAGGIPTSKTEKEKSKLLLGDLS